MYLCAELVCNSLYKPLHPVHHFGKYTYRIVGIRSPRLNRSRPQIEALVNLTFYLVNFGQKIRQND